MHKHKNGIRNLEAYGDEPDDLLKGHNNSYNLHIDIAGGDSSYQCRRPKTKDAKSYNSNGTLGKSPMRRSSTTHDNSEQRVSF